MIDCTGHPNLLAFPPIPVTKENELSSNATDIYNIQEYDNGDAPFARGDLVKKDGYVYVSKEDNNSELLAVNEEDSLAIDGFLKIVGSGFMSTTYSGANGFAGATPVGGSELLTDISDGMKLFEPGLLGSYLNLQAYKTWHFGIATREATSVDCQVKVNDNLNFNTSDTNITVAVTISGSNKYLNFTLQAGQFVVMAVYESASDSAYNGYYIHAGYMQGNFGTDNPFRKFYSFIKRAYYSNGNSGSPITLLNPEETPNDPNFAYLGWFIDGDPIPHDPTQYFTKGMYVNDSSNKYRTTKIMPADSNRTGFELQPALITFSVKLKSNLTKWVLVGSTNENSIYQPSPRIMTLADGTLSLSWSISEPFTALTLASVLGQTMVVTITSDDDDAVLFTDTYDLTQSNPTDYTGWLFGNTESKLVDSIHYDDIAWSEAGVTISIEVTSSNNAIVGLGAVYPSNPKTLGLMNYAPVISGITTTRKVNHLELIDVEVVKLGTSTDKVNYKTQTPSEWLDGIVDTLRHIATLATEDGLPTYFVGQYPYDSLKILGYMPTYDQTLSNEKQTSSALNITGAL